MPAQKTRTLSPGKRVKAAKAESTAKTAKRTLDPERGAQRTSQKLNSSAGRTVRCLREPQSIDEWFAAQDRAVQRISVKLRRARQQVSAGIDPVELDRRTLVKVHGDEKLFVEAVLVARNLARMGERGDADCGYDLVCDAWADLPRWFRDMRARHSKVNGAPIPGRAAAAERHRESIREHVEAEMVAELQAARCFEDEVREVAAQAAESSILNFAQNLEIARIVYQNHPRLVKSTVFPEPYRAAIKQEDGYDPNEESGIDVNDGHLNDPEADRAKNEAWAREIVAERHRKG